MTKEFINICTTHLISSGAVFFLLFMNNRRSRQLLDYDYFELKQLSTISQIATNYVRCADKNKEVDRFKLR